jgi:alpha-glucan phosphorylase-like protein
MDKSGAFFSSINRPELDEVITDHTPWTYFTMELGLPGFSFAGGLGILAGDTYLQAKKSEIPYVCVTLLYPQDWRQIIEDFYQKEVYFDYQVEHMGFEKAGTVEIQANNDIVRLDVLVKKEGASTIIALYEPGLRELYYGSSSSDHRLYQEAVLGFGGYKAVKLLGLDPSLIHLNEASTVSAVLAALDDLVTREHSVSEALAILQKKTLFTNHTLVPAAVASFTKEQYEHYVLSNIKNEEIKSWLLGLTEADGKIKRSTIAMEVCGRLNGVSKMHAEVASSGFKKRDGSNAYFHPVTNGIFLERWMSERLFKLYKTCNVIDHFTSPQKQYIDMVTSWSAQELVESKNESRKRLRDYISARFDQYNNGIVIPESAKIISWAKRFASYKRPGMILQNLERVKGILTKYDFHILLSGTTHVTDEGMKSQMKQLFQEIDNDEVLRARVHYIQEYDEGLGFHLVAGSDIWLNTPEVEKEACGTSWMKSIANLGILVTTIDGGVADLQPSPYLEIHGASFEDEVQSLYKQVEKAGDLLGDEEAWREYVLNQLKESLYLMSSARMMKDYLDLVF